MAVADQLQAPSVLSSITVLVLLLTVTSKWQHLVLGEGHSAQHEEAASTKWYFWNEVAFCPQPSPHLCIPACCDIRGWCYCTEEKLRITHRISCWLPR